MRGVGAARAGRCEASAWLGRQANARFLGGREGTCGRCEDVADMLPTYMESMRESVWHSDKVYIWLPPDSDGAAVL